MADQRIEQYARLLVDTCVDVQPGWEVMVISTPIARPLLEELARQIGRKGAYVYQRLDFTGATGRRRRRLGRDRARRAPRRSSRRSTGT